MRDEDRGAVAEHPFDRRGNQLLAHRVERAGRLVKNETPRIGQQGPRDGQALALSARKIRPALPQPRVQSGGQVAEKFEGVGLSAGFEDLAVGRFRSRHAQVVAQRRVEKEGILRHHAEVTAQGRGRERPQVGAADGDRSGLRIVEAEQQLGDRRLARPRRTDQGQLFTHRDAQVEVRQHRPRRVVTEGHAGEDNPAPLGPFAARIARVGRGCLRVEHRPDAGQSGLGPAPQGEGLENSLDRPAQPGESGQAGGDHAEIDIAAQVAPSAGRHEHRIADVTQALLLDPLHMGEHIAPVAFDPDDVRLLLETARHLRLHGMEFDRLVAAQQVGDTSAHIAFRRLKIALDPLHATSRTQHHDHAEECGDKKNRGQHPIPDQEHGHGGNQGHGRARHVHGRMVEKIDDRPQRRAEEVAEQLAAGVLAVEAQAKVIHMAEKPPPQGKDDVFADPREEPESPVPQKHPQHRGEEKVDERQLSESPPALGRPEAGRLQHVGKQPFGKHVLHGRRAAAHPDQHESENDGPPVLPQERTHVTPEGPGRRRR